MSLVKRDGQLHCICRYGSTIDGRKIQKYINRDVQVLDEETYVQSLNEIIQRYFFPELSKLRAQHEYLNAVEHNDVEKLREISARYQVTSTQTPSGELATPVTFKTPSTVHDTPAPSHSAPDNNREADDGKSSTETKSSNKKDESDLTLDRFLTKNTSEDNASFEQMMETSLQKHKEKYQWLYEKEQEQKERKETMLALTTAEDGDQFKYEDIPSMIETWNYTNKNVLMYYPEGVDASVQEKIEGRYTKRQQILHGNSRFMKDPFPEESCDDKLAAAAATRLAAQHGNIGVDGQVQGSNETPKVKGYGFVATPSPAPGTKTTEELQKGNFRFLDD